MSKYIRWYFVILFCALSPSIFTLAILPYPAFRSSLNALAPDKNFSTLSPDNALIVRLVVLFIALFFAITAYLTLSSRWKAVLVALRQILIDCAKMFRLASVSKRETAFLALLLLIVFIGIVYRWSHINDPLGHDEAYTIVTFADTFYHAIRDYHLPNNHVFHTLLVVISKAIFGFQPWGVRFPAFLAGVFIIPGVYFLGKRLYDPWTGLGAALLVALSPSLMSYSTNARGYTLVAFFMLLTLLLGDFVVRQKNLFAWLLISVFSALGFYTVPVMLFPFGVLYVWLFLRSWKDRSSEYSNQWQFLCLWVASGVGAALLTLILYLPILLYAGPQKLFANPFVSGLPWQDFWETIVVRLQETWAEWTYQVPGLVVAILVIGWLLALIFHKKISSLEVPLQGAAGIWIVTLLVIQRPNAYAKVWVFLTPLMLLWAAAGIFGLLRKIRLKVAGLDFSVAALLLALLLTLSGSHTLDLLSHLPASLAQKGDVEKSILYVRDNLLEDHTLIVVDWPDDSPVWYYALLHGIDFSHFDRRVLFDRAVVLVEPLEGQTVASVNASRGPDYPAIDVASCRLQEKFGKMQIFLCPVIP